MKPCEIRHCRYEGIKQYNFRFFCDLHFLLCKGELIFNKVEVKVNGKS